MLRKIIDEDGRIVEFEEARIVEAIRSVMFSMHEHDEALAKNIASRVVSILEENFGPDSMPTVEQVEDLIVKALVDCGYHRVAKAYIFQRALHTQIKDLVDGYLKKRTWLVKENANTTYSLQALNFHISSQVISSYWLHRIYYKRNPRIVEAHYKGDFHIHNLGILGPYCVGWDLRDLLLIGFRGVRGKTWSNPAKHFRVALGQVTNFIFTLQGEAAGAQAFSNFDTLLSPFIRYDALDYTTVKQALQEFIFNMNVPTRVGFQTPFSNITLDLTVPRFMENEPVVVGGEVKDDVYGDFQEEMDVFNVALAEVMLEGDALGRPFTFPIPTINVTNDFRWESAPVKGILETCAKYGLPYFANFINSDMRPEDVRSMCCRLRIDTKELRRRGGGLFGSNPLTGSIGVVTINMPRIGYLSKDETKFFEMLEERMSLARDALEIKREWLERLTEDGLYPFSKFYLRNVKGALGEYWKNHFSTIGLVGMNECCVNLLGCSIGDAEGLRFAEKTLEFMRKVLLEFQEATGNLYNLEATPAESAAYRLAKIDKSTYPDIFVANDGYTKTASEPYYTNSSQLPVYYTDDLWEALRLQEPLQTKYTGGTVFHIWLGESYPPVESIAALVRKVCENFRIPYFTVSPTFSVCEEHGYIRGRVHACPKCGRPTEVYSRVVGYLRPVEQWNVGKQEEFKQRRTFDRTALENG
ncbi:MAG: ribonucleoside triphosphate reductase [Candidatus Terraquivivens tikiterensis]|uniref:Ribonucleoside triphosphate reductase n=1 Tax=Candidatus Terraquivivens tikiterensis TaxID=1980982 RepID=A0A2R7Y9W9_9ARCH|nr:MAG: ribonucleoside triphosphate reductase [Candidatus Terraquivivens tikiterensis]